MGWELIQANCIGANGSAVGHGVLHVNDGILTEIYVEAGNVPASTGLTLKSELPNGKPITLLTLSNVAAPYNNPIQAPVVGNTGVSTVGYAFRSVTGQLHVDVTQANAGLVNVWVFVL